MPAAAGRVSSSPLLVSPAGRQPSRNRARRRPPAAQKTARRDQQLATAAACGVRRSGAFMSGTVAWPASGSRCRLNATKMHHRDQRERKPLYRVAKVALRPDAERRSPDALVAIGPAASSSRSATRRGRPSACLEVGLPREIMTRGQRLSPGGDAAPTYAGDRQRSRRPRRRVLRRHADIRQGGRGCAERHPAAVHISSRSLPRRGGTASARGTRPAGVRGMLSSSTWRSGS